ncbi:MAG TPA: redoxin domain-containing protein [Solirubrobacteraceae bacterium]|nr:redoxin domain-containing protein [Solirubrobacteraceae bacterium]
MSGGDGPDARPDPGAPGADAQPDPGAPGAPPLGLDPELAARAARTVRQSGPPRPAPPVVDTRRYRWMIGVFGLVVVVVVSLVSFLQHGVVTTGVPARQALRDFAAPLASSNLNGDANVAHPTCTLARHDPRALNLCLLAKRGPLVLAFFTGGQQCTREVDTMQALAPRFLSVQFAAVAVKTSHAAAARLVRVHGWTIPVAYDADGAVGLQYGVDVCPLVELAYRGGIVQARLIGDHWAEPAVLAQRIRVLEGPQPR